MCSKRGLLSSFTVHLLIAGPSGSRMWALEHQASGVASRGLNSCSSKAQAQQFWPMGLVVSCMWNLPRTEIEPMSPTFSA